MENLELDVNASQHAVIHRLADKWNSVEEDRAEGDGVLERAEGDGDCFRSFDAQPMKAGQRRSSVCQPSCHASRKIRLA